MMGLRRAAAFVLGFCVCATACNDTTPPPQPAAFERPTRLAFVCVDKNMLSTPELALTALSNCTPPPPPPPGETAPAITTNYTLHAVITQSSRGEVGAVDIPALSAIDTRNDIPGPTFVPTGELPVAVAIAPDFPQWTYVANAGSRDISVIRTAALLHVGAGEAYLQQDPVPIRLSTDSPSVVPFDLAISPDQKALFVTSAEAGLLLRYPIKKDGQLDVEKMVSVPLDASWAKLSPDAFAPRDTHDEPYEFTCDASKTYTTEDKNGTSIQVPFQLPTLLPLPNTPIVLPAKDANVPTVQPAGMAVDAYCEKENEDCTARLLIADRAQPIIHVVDFDTLENGNPADAILTPILSGAPTERVAATPAVPVAVSGSESNTPTHYVYAIDSHDGSVLVAQKDPTLNVERTINVSVNPSARADRLDLGPAFGDGPPVALSLAVLTPGYIPRNGIDQWLKAPIPTPTMDEPTLCLDPDHETRSPNRLRGVFLAVGLTDGSVRIVTVHDLELRECRACTRPTDLQSYSPFNPGYDPYPVVRNRTRISLGYSAASTGESPTIVPAVAAQFEINGTVLGVKFDGTTNDPRAPGLDCIPCSDAQDVSFPQPTALMPLSGDAGVPVDASVAADASMEASDATKMDAGATMGTAGDMAHAGAGGTAGSTATMPDAGTSSAVNDYTGCNDLKHGRVCSAHDPWIDASGWSAAYEGLVPGTRGGHGRFVNRGDAGNESGSLEFQGEVDFCSAGVQGDDVVNPGDQIQITSALPADEIRNQHPELRPLCDALVNARDVNYEAIAFRIRSAYADHLVIDPQAIPSRMRRPDATWDNVRDCFGGMELAFQVHARASFIVQGGRNGFQHRIVKNAGSGHCEIDPSLPETHVGRAYPGKRFDNGLVAFQPSAGDYDPLAVLSLTSSTNTVKMFFNASDIISTRLSGVMPVDIKYSAADNRMYVLDVTTRGLMPVPLDPMPQSLDPSYCIQ